MRENGASEGSWITLKRLEKEQSSESETTCSNWEINVENISMYDLVGTDHLDVDNRINAEEDYYDRMQELANRTLHFDLDYQILRISRDVYSGKLLNYGEQEDIFFVSMEFKEENIEEIKITGNMIKDSFLNSGAVIGDYINFERTKLDPSPDILPCGVSDLWEIRKDEEKSRESKEAVYSGQLLDHGKTKDPHNPDKMNYFVLIQKGNKQKEVWGTDLERAMHESGVQKGENITLENTGKKPVMVDKNIKENGKIVGTDKIEVMRNSWEIIKDGERNHESKPHRHISHPGRDPGRHLGTDRRGDRQGHRTAERVVRSDARTVP